MKLINQHSPSAALPDSTMVCEMILRLNHPFHVMAWIMMETATRISDLQTMRVHDIDRDNKTLFVHDEEKGRTIPLSEGLVSALDEYLVLLREKFENNKRWLNHSRRENRAQVPMFADQLLFPAWQISGHEKALLNESISVALFVRALQSAAMDAGYAGLIQSNTLRLVCAARWMEQGITVNEIHQKLGHRDLLTTMLMIQALKYGGLTFAAPTNPAVNNWTELSRVA